MTFLSAVADWFGLCPKHPVIRTAPAVLVVRNDIVQSAGPAGDAGVPARILGGAGIALSGARTLRQNKQLLWFSYMTGIVMALVFISQYLLRVLSVYPYDAISPIQGFILTSIIELVCVFCLTVLAAGLILTISHKELGEPASFYEGIVRTREFLHSLAGWAVIMAILGTTIFVLLGMATFIINSVTHMYISPDKALSLFPFGFILMPELVRIGPIGGTFAMKAAVTTTELLGVVNGILFFLTMFVVPLLVLEKRSIPEAVTGSVMLMKTVIYEALGCFLLLVLVVSAAAATALLFPITYGIVRPDMMIIYYPGKEWIGAAVLFMFALYGLVCVVSTVAGIAIVDLYSRSKEREPPGDPEHGDAVAAAEPAC